jgi:CheY-like chemotaxis protein
LNNSRKSFSVLLADDSDDDRYFMRLALGNSPQLKIVAEVVNGEEAIDYLSGTKVYHNREKYPFPDLLLLDLKMPRFTGFEVLAWLREQHFPDLKVVVISGSNLQQDKAQALDLGATAYYLKPASREEQQQLVQGVEALLKGSV